MAPPYSGLYSPGSGTLPFTATGGTAARSAADRAAERVNVKDFGAKGDGKTDDSAAINATIAYARSLKPSGYLAATIEFPQAVYVVGSSLNLTGIKSWPGLVLKGNGSTLLGKCTGAPVIDALGSRWLKVYDLLISGDATNTPTIGLQIGRINGQNSDSSDEHEFHDLQIGGNFSFAALYNFSAETVLYDHCLLGNSYNGASASYALVLDGVNHWNASSAFITQQAPAETPQSFKGNVLVNCRVAAYGSGSPLWLANLDSLELFGTYVVTTGTGPYGITLYHNNNGSAIHNLMADVHMEMTGHLTDVFFLTGPNATPVVHGLIFRDDSPYASNSFFKLDTNITSATLADLDAHIALVPLGSGVKFFDNASLWTVSGKVALPSAANWTPPASFNGTTDLNGVVTHSGYGTFTSLGGGLAYSNGVLSWTAPNPLQVNTVQASGGVGAITTPSGGNFYVTSPNGTGFPTITLGAPSTGGTQATAVVATMGLNGPNGIANGGSGYAVNDIVTLVGGTYTTAGAIKVTAVGTGGVVTGVSGYYQGAGYTALPAGPIATAGGTGTGLTLTSAAWFVKTVTVTASGSGYTLTPSVTFTPASGTTMQASPSTSVSMNNAFSASGGGYASLTLDAAGAHLGVSGTSGVPVLASGALIDNSGVRVSLGATYTVPANTSLVRFNQTATVAASTVTLPTALGDGHPIQFVNYAGAVTALTFSPAVNGWTNGGTLAANTGIRVRWDSLARAWYREQ